MNKLQISPNSDLELLVTQKITAVSSIQVPNHSQFRYLYVYVSTNDAFSGDAFIIPKVLYSSYKKYVNIQALPSTEKYWVHLSITFAAGSLKMERVNFGSEWDYVYVMCYGIK